MMKDSSSIVTSIPCICPSTFEVLYHAANAIMYASLMCHARFTKYLVTRGGCTSPGWLMLLFLAINPLLSVRSPVRCPRLTTSSSSPGVVRIRGLRHSTRYNQLGNVP